jgi:hypothetical protein
VRARFVSNLTAAIAGGVLVAGSFAFRPATSAWIALGVACLTVITVLAAFAARGRGPAARTIDVLLTIAGVWTIVASRVFAASLAKWLAFADGALLFALAVVGLIVHEALIEHELRAAQRPAPAQHEPVPLSPVSPQMRRTAG